MNLIIALVTLTALGLSIWAFVAPCKSHFGDESSEKCGKGFPVKIPPDKCNTIGKKEGYPPCCSGYECAGDPNPDFHASCIKKL